jgi:hypothetical protein
VGVYGGPEIANDGLILALDGANFKSFKGEATTNELVSVTWSGDGSNQASFTKGSQLITDENLKYKGYETYLWSPGTSLNCYLNGADLSTGRTSTVWTFSCYVKREDGAPITSLSVYMYYPSSDGSAAGTIEDAGNGWYRVSRTRTGTVNYLSLIGFTGFVTGYKYYLSGAQLEKKSYATTVVATNTTRGTTVATGGGWANLTGAGNNGELVNGVKESADNLGALIFDGTNDYGVVSSSSSNILTTLTLECWFKRIGVPGGGFHVLFQKEGGYSGSGVYGLRCNDLGTAYGNISTGSGINQVFYLYSTVTIADNTWYHICMTYDSGYNMKLYVNAVLENSRSDIGAVPFQNSSSIVIGTGDSRFTNGNIASMKIYNRALTASEIQQNFNANRSRFGI